MNFKTTLIVLVVFVILGGAYLLFWQSEPEEESQAEQQKISEAYGLDKAKIRRIRLSFKDESYQPLDLTKTVDTTWQLTNPLIDDADNAKVDEMLRDLLDKRVKRTMEADDLAQYGLEPPNIQIEVWTEGESPVKTFLIGNQGISYSAYAKEKSEAGIFLIESSALDDFTKSPSDLRDKAVMKFEPNTVSGVILQVTGQTAIRCQKNGDGTWTMVEPVKAKADVKQIEAMLTALDTLKIIFFEAEGNVALKTYGLDAPRMRVRIQLEDNTSQELLIGGDDEVSERIYAKRLNVGSVYAVNREIYATLNQTVFDLRDKRVIDFQRTSTTRFEIQSDNETIVCEKRVGGEWSIKEPVQLKADASAVDDLLFGVDSLGAVEFVDRPLGQLTGLARPAFKISFTVPDADTATLLIGKQKGDNVYVKTQNDETVFLVKRDILDLIRMGVAGLRNKQILDFKSDDAVKLTLRHGKVSLTCQKQGTNWRLTSPVKEDAKNGAVNAIIYQINALKVEKFLPDAPDDATTGLDKPTVQVNVTLRDRTEYALQIGKLAGDDRNYARLLRKPDTLFLLKTDVAESLKKTVEDLRAISDAE